MKTIYRIFTVVFFALITIIGAYSLLNVKFEFNFEDFLPQNDPDLEFFKDFVRDFETDDNFYLIALENKAGVFEQSYLQQIDKLTNDLKQIESVKDITSLTSLQQPKMTPFGVQMTPIIPLDGTANYTAIKSAFAEDERFRGTLVSEDFTSSIINLKLRDSIDLDTSNELVDTINEILSKYDFEENHSLGRANFQKAMIEMSRNEIIMSSIMASILVLIVMIVIFRKFTPVLLAMGAIGFAFMGFLSYMYLSGQAFNAMAGLFPILMIIVSTSDVIHLLSKYIDELRKTGDRNASIKVTIKDIGLATLLTSVTTSIGFITLLFSRLKPIQQFGLNAAAGVMIAFVIIVLFAALVFPYFNLTQLARPEKTMRFWENILGKWYDQTKKYGKTVALSSIIVLIISIYGISKITTNYKLVTNLPRGAKITADYLYFENEFSGFRPLELAITAGKDKTIDDFEVMQEIVKVENHLREYPVIKNIIGYSMIYKSINRFMNGNTAAQYSFPKDEDTFNQYKKLAKFVPSNTSSLLISKDSLKTRISSRVDDIGAEEVQDRIEKIRSWIDLNTDKSIASFVVTGTAMLLDKNMFYVRESLLKGLGFAIIIVSIIMVLLFRNWKLIIISIIPNILPLLFSAAIIGFIGVELEAGMSIVFAIAFGIAVDDTIHFLSKYKLERNKGKDMEAALKTTYLETGKAIIFTSIILFFGFLVLFFSIHPPSRSIGVLIAVTLVSALVADLYMIPYLIRLLTSKDDVK